MGAPTRPTPGGHASVRAVRASEVPLTNPFSLTSAVKFAAVFAAVLLVVALVRRSLLGQGLYAVAGLAGLTDVDAITLSMAGYARDGGDPAVAVNAITIGALSNTVVKGVMVATLGTVALGGGWRLPPCWWRLPAACPCCCCDRCKAWNPLSGEGLAADRAGAAGSSRG